MARTDRTIDRSKNRRVDASRSTGQSEPPGQSLPAARDVLPARSSLLASSLRRVLPRTLSRRLRALRATAALFALDRRAEHERRGEPPPEFPHSLPFVRVGPTINGPDRRHRLQSCSTKVKRSNQGYLFEPLDPNTASPVREPPALTASARNDCEALTAIPAGIRLSCGKSS